MFKLWKGDKTKMKNENATIWINENGITMVTMELDLIFELLKHFDLKEIEK